MHGVDGVNRSGAGYRTRARRVAVSHGTNSHIHGLMVQLHIGKDQREIIRSGTLWLSICQFTVLFIGLLRPDDGRLSRQ